MNINLSYFGRSLAVQKLKASANHCIDSFVEATILRKSFEGPATFWWVSSSGWFQMGLLQGHGFKVTPPKGNMLAFNDNDRRSQSRRWEFKKAPAWAELPTPNILSPTGHGHGLQRTVTFTECSLVFIFIVVVIGCRRWRQWHCTGKDMEGPPMNDRPKLPKNTREMDTVDSAEFPVKEKIYRLWFGNFSAKALLPLHSFWCVKSPQFCRWLWPWALDPNTAFAMDHSRIHQSSRTSFHQVLSSTSVHMTFNPQFLLPMSHEMADGGVHKEWVKMQQQLELLVNLC